MLYWLHQCDGNTVPSPYANHYLNASCCMLKRGWNLDTGFSVNRVGFQNAKLIAVNSYCVF